MINPGAVRLGQTRRLKRGFRKRVSFVEAEWRYGSARAKSPPPWISAFDGRLFDQLDVEFEVDIKAKWQGREIEYEETPNLSSNYCT